MIGYSNSEHPLLFSSEQLARDLCIVIVAVINDIKSSFFVVYYLNVLVLVYTIHLSVGG